MDEEEDLLAEYRELEDREECIQDALELIVERVNAHVEASDLQSKVVGYAAREAVKDALAVVDMTFLERESFAKRGATVAEDSRGTWEPDEDTEPAPIDVWARGAVKARRRQKAPTPDAKITRSLVQRIFGRGSGASSRYGGESLRKSTSGLSKTGAAKPKISPELEEAEQRLREEIETRREVQKMHKLQLQKDQEELKELETLQRQLRGKDYGYDHKGKVVVMQKLDPEKLPGSYAVGMRVKVTDDREDDIRQETSSTKMDATHGVKKLNRVDYIKPEKRGQPSLMDTLNVSMGVTFREGAGAKAGAPLSSTAQKMSREDFMELVNRQQMGASTMSRKSTLAARTAPGSKQQRIVQPDPNLELLSAGDWGVNPPSAMRERPYVPPTLYPKAASRGVSRRT